MTFSLVWLFSRLRNRVHNGSNKLGHDYTSIPTARSFPMLMCIEIILLNRLYHNFNLYEWLALILCVMLSARIICIGKGYLFVMLFSSAPAVNSGYSPDRPGG